MSGFTTMPIVIAQGLRFGGNGLNTNRRGALVVSVVAWIQSIRLRSDRIEYKIRDITGTMTAVQWVYSNNANPFGRMPKEKTYVQIYGNLKDLRQRNILSIHNMRCVDDVNLITFHYLRCIDIKVKADAAASKKNETNVETVPVRDELKHNRPIDADYRTTDSNNSRIVNDNDSVEAVSENVRQNQAQNASELAMDDLDELFLDHV